MLWIIPPRGSMSISLILMSIALSHHFYQTDADTSVAVNASGLEDKMVLHFVEVNLMPKAKREAKKSTQVPFQSRNNGTTKVFRRSKIRKKLPRRFAKYRHSTRVIRGKPAIVLLPPFYRRPIVQNYTIRPPAMMEHPIHVPVAPIDMPTPLPEPLILSDLVENTSPSDFSTHVPDYSYPPQSVPVTTEFYTEMTSTTYNTAPSTILPSTEMEPFIQWQEELQSPSFGLEPPQNIDGGFTLMTYNDTDIMYEEPPPTIVQYLLPPLWQEFDESPRNTVDQLKNDFPDSANDKEPNIVATEQPSVTAVTTQATTTETDMPYNELEYLKPPDYDNNFFWTEYRNQSVFNVDVNNALTSTGDFNNMQYREYSVNENRSAPYMDVNLSLLASDVASKGMKVEATAKAIEMARDMMRNQAVDPTQDEPNQRRQDIELPLAVAESGHLRLHNEKYTRPKATGSTTVRSSSKKKPYKRLTDEVIPGVAGQDYPVYATPPPPTQKSPCKENFGYIPDPSTRCQVFYVCTGTGMGEPMLCPNGTLFSRDFLVCDWWYNVECTPD